jgi:cell fate (sporulation/competence/biofilm development) regulator YlbF (YheA/YmcA/DUF963 family)
MSKVDELASQLADAILESDEYKYYIECKNEISKNPQLFQAVNELRRHTFEIQNSESIGNMYDEIVKNYDRYEYIRSSIIANKFLRSELSVCRMVHDIQSTLVENLDFNLDFME